MAEVKLTKRETILRRAYQKGKISLAILQKWGTEGKLSQQEFKNITS